MAKFCGKCGSRLDEATGLCPNCDAERLEAIKSEESAGASEAQESHPDASEPNNQDTASANPAKADGKRNSEPISTDKPLSKKEAKNSERKIKKAAKKAKKKEKRAGWSIGKKIRHFIFKLLLIILLVALLATGVLCALVYFGILDFPEVSYILSRSGIERKVDIDADLSSNNYIPKESSIVFDDSSQSYYANDEIIIFFSMGTTDSEKEQVFDYLNGELVGESSELNMYQVILSEKKSLNELSSIADDILNKFDCVVFATYDTATIDHDEYAPNDPWNKDVSNEDWNDSDVDGSNWWIEAIDGQGAWDYGDEYSKIKIGICDSSFDTGHEDLKNRVSFPNDVLKSRNVVTPWWYSFDNLKHLSKWNVSEQMNYHGTHVAGIIGAEGDNKKGITGIVQNCDILLAPYYRSDNMEAYLAWDSSTYANLAYLVEAGAKVINFSQGKTNFLEENNEANLQYDEAVIEREGNLASISISQLIQAGHKDFLVVQSAGNGTGDTGKALDAIQNGWFSSITTSSITGSADILIEEVLSHVIIVGAAEQTSDGYRCTSFSNFGSQVDIVAPGSNIYSTIPGEVFYDFQFFGGYGFASGTSMSAPIVTGVCALVWSINPELNNSQVKEIVCKTHDTLVSSHPDTEDSTAYYMVNARLSVEAARSFSINSDSLTEVTSTIPTDAVEFNGHYYYLYDGEFATSYDDALQYCIDNGGYLATITSQEENDFVYSYITGLGCETAYLGLSDASSEGDWQWCTGESLSYINWHSGEPNGENSNEDYAMFYYKYSDGTWNDGDFGGSTVNGGKSFICEWGDYTPSSGDTKTGESDRTTSDERDIVLALDVSGSMSGTPIDETRKASINFIEAILEEDASIGIVTYENYANRNSDFSVNKSSLESIVSGIRDGGGTNIEAGLNEAYSMLESSSAKKKIIVLMSDGEPNDGKEGDELVAYADEIKSDGVLIYTLGFFESLGNDKSAAQQLMERMASDGCHYEVGDADDLVFFFEDMADQINGQRYIYVRIACPVDVSVTYEGETLSSAEKDFNTRTDFGTLTFEQDEEDLADGIDDRVKILRLKEGANYDLKIIGTGHGIMDYTIGFMDDEGNYSDLRQFEDVKITKRTVIDTVASVSKISTLNIDQDGDGKYDLKLQAEENGYGEEVTQSNILYYIVGGAALLCILLVIMIVLKARRKRKGMVNN